MKPSYADALLDIIDPNHTIKFGIRLDWMIALDIDCIDSTACASTKTISKTWTRSIARLYNRKLDLDSQEKTVIIDNTPYAFGYQIDNGIPITSWFDDKIDTALKELIPFLQELVKAEDVRPVLRKKYKLKEKLDGFVYGWSVCYKQA